MRENQKVRAGTLDSSTSTLWKPTVSNNSEFSHHESRSFPWLFPHLCWFTLRYPRWLLKKQGSLPPQPLTQSQAWHPGCTICPWSRSEKTTKCGIATFVSENYLETSRWFDNFWWFLMFSDGFWWVSDGFLMVSGGFWWFLIVFWWFLMVFDGFWWFVAHTFPAQKSMCFFLKGLLPDPILCIKECWYVMSPPSFCFWPTQKVCLNCDPCGATLRFS